MDERSSELNLTVGRLIGVVEQMDKRLSEVSQSLQHLAASQENMSADNAAQHEQTARDIVALTVEARQLTKDVKELKEDVKELKKKNGSGGSLEAFDKLLTFWEKWKKVIVPAALAIGTAIVTWLGR